MPIYPNTFSLATGRGYYGPSLNDSRNQPESWTTRPPTPFYGQQYPSSNLLTAGGIAAGVFAAGFIPLKRGRVWDKYVGILRGIEEYSPGGIFRTFQASTFFSQFTSQARAGFHVSPQFLRGEMGRGYANYLARLIGETKGKNVHARILREGVTLRGGQLFYGTGDKVALEYASALISPTATKVSDISKWVGGELGVVAGRHYGSAYARSMGLELSSKDARLFGEVLGEGPERFHTQIIGGRTRTQHMLRQAGAWGTEWVSRFNRLLEAPFEMQPLSGLYKKFGGRINLAVPYAGGARMLGSLAWKYGAVAGALGLGYQTLDYLLRQSETLEGTTIGTGITGTLATGAVQANLLASKAADLFGLHRYRELQEELAPGSTELSRLLAFPIMGALGAAGIGYGLQVSRMAKLQATTSLSAAAARAKVASELSEFGTEGLLGYLGKRFADTKIFGSKMTPTKLGGLLGAGIGAALIAPFLPGALTPGTRPEELEAIYRGEQEVPIRKGRWWELGRSPWEGNRIMYYRPHWYPRMMMRAKERAIWGEEEPSPIEKWWTREFTYELEKKFYRERPYPITSLPFEDVPFIGPLLAGTIGRLIKPPVLMHREEWMGEGGGVKTMPPRFGERVATEIGEQPHGAPISPYSLKGIAGEQVYRMCFTSNTWVKLADKTYSKICDLKINDEIYLPKKNEKITHIFKRRKNEDDNILGIYTQGDFFPLEVTDNHKVLTLKTNYCPSRGGNCNPSNSKNSRHYKKCKYKYCDNISPKWDSVKNLKVGDFLIEPVEILVTESNDVDLINLFPKEYITLKDRVIFWTKRSTINRTRSYKNRVVSHVFEKQDKPNKKRAISQSLPLNFETGWLIGYFLAEGTVKSSGIAFGANLLEKETHIKYVDCLLKKYINPFLNLYISYKKKNGKLTNGIEATYSSPILRELFSNFIYQGEKYIPKQFLTGPKDYLVGIINGMIDGDGHQREKEISINLSTRYLLKQIQKILYNLGIITGALSYSGYTDIGNLYTGVSLIISQTGIKKLSLYNDLGFKVRERLLSPIHTNSSRNFIIEKGDHILVYKRISKIKELNYDGFLYDLEVSNQHIYIANDSIVHNSEMIGLPGFTMTAIKEALTGTPDMFDQMMQLESARRAYGFERSYWDLELGGGLGSSEALRRLYPHRRRQIPLYNPIRNLMPEWLSGPGEKAPDFLHGDPFVRIPEGELRLPGEGYEQRFPELEGVEPADYPLIHRYKILADVAPYSDKFKLALQQVRSARKLDTWTEYEENIYKTTEEQLKSRKVRKEFEEYKYLSPTGKVFDKDTYYAGESSDLLARLNEIKRDQQEEPGIFSKLFGGYWELLAHNAETALDTMTPVSPGAKLVHQRTAIEDYHRTQVYGTESAFWSHPMRDFIRPTLTRAAAALGFEGIPGHLKDKRGILEYFDILEYVKASRLANLARMSGDSSAAREFEDKKNETLFGVNPFTYNFSHIYRSLPRSERDYFNAFTAADTVEERAKILDMVPENERALYVARWKMQFKQDLEQAKKADLLSQEQEDEADKLIEGIREEARSEGMPTSRELFAEYASTKLSGENYADWYRRTRLLPEIPLPGPDWVAWHPSVNLEDVKLKLIQNLGEDMHSYDLWPDRARALVNKPYINEAALEPFYSPEELSEDEMRDRVNDLMLANKVDSQIFFRTSFGTSPGSMIDIEQDVNIDDAISRLI